MITAQDAQDQAGDSLTVTLRPIPGIMADVPLAVRWRRVLKTLKRRYGLKASWPTPEDKSVAVRSGGEVKHGR
jgi:hypothetical protein